MRTGQELAPISQAEFEAMVRRYLVKVGARYVPVAAIALAIGLIIAFVPTKQPLATVGPGLQANGAQPQYSAATTQPGSTGAATPVASAGPATSSRQSGAQPGAVPAAGTSGVSGPAATVPLQLGHSGAVSKTGVRCGPGVRQFTWSRYAPPCVGAFQGYNGGATAPGVTATTITLSYRLANSTQQAAIDALAGAANINQDDYVADLNSYINYFNSQFELYGRHVVLKTYQGTADYIAEDQGQDLGATQADAVTAHDLGAFGDVTFSLQASQYYEQDLAAEHVIGFSAVGLSQQWFEQYAPYEYSVQGPSGTNSVTGSSQLVCRRMAGMPAIFAGDVLYQHTTRKFGIIYPQTPVYTAEANQFKQELASCGVNNVPTIGYTINIAEYETEATSAMAMMRSQGVTSLLCACDPIVDIFLTNAADQQQYYPEWIATYFGDPISRNYDQAEWSHAITGGWQWAPIDTTEPYRTFERAYPGRHPAEWQPSSPPYFYVPYYTLLQIFDALQAAGPILTPYTFERGMFSLPPSIPGDYYYGGYWVFGNQVFDPIVSGTITWWDPNAVSDFDGAKGAFEWCNGGQVYTLMDPAALGSGQLHCFGK